MKNRSDLNRQIDIILKNKTSGSTDILLHLNSLLLKYHNDPESFKVILNDAKKGLSYFRIIQNYISGLEKVVKKNNPEFTLQFLNKWQNTSLSAKDIYQRAKPFLKNISVVLTLSFSRTVAEFLKCWKNDLQELKVFICESRPKYEGRLLASELLKSDIKVEMITDSSAGIFIKQCGAVLIGADSILKNGNIVNKTGSLSAALLCKENGKPFFVAAGKEKFSDSYLFKQKEQIPTEVWKKKHKNLKIRNYYFEEVDKKYVTRIFS